MPKYRVYSIFSYNGQSGELTRDIIANSPEEAEQISLSKSGRDSFGPYESVYDVTEI